MMGRAFIPLLAAFVLTSPAYPADPRAFEVTVALTIDRPEQPVHRQASFALRLTDTRFRLELGQVIVVGERLGGQDTICAWHRHDPTSVFLDRDAPLPILVRRNLPPIWCGPLADWLADAELAYPLVARDWAFPPHSERTGDAVMLECPGVRYERRLDADRSTILSESIRIDRVSGDERLDVAYTTIDPGDPADWSIDPAARTPVASIAALRAKPARFNAGDVVSLRLFQPDDQSWRLASAFEPEPSAFQHRQASALVLVFSALSPRAAELDVPVDPGEAIALLTELRTRVASLCAQRGVARPVFVARPVGVFDVPRFDRGRLQTMLSQAASLPTDPLLPDIESSAPHVLWAQPPEESIDLFCPGARTALIILDPQRRLVAALRVDDQRKAAVESAAHVLLGDVLDPAQPDRD